MLCIPIADGPCFLKANLKLCRDSFCLCISFAQCSLTVISLYTAVFNHRIFKYIKELPYVELRDLCRRLINLHRNTLNKRARIFWRFDRLEKREARVKELCISIHVRHSLTTLTTQLR